MRLITPATYIQFIYKGQSSTAYLLLANVSLIKVDVMEDPDVANAIAHAFEHDTYQLSTNHVGTTWRGYALALAVALKGYEAALEPSGVYKGLRLLEAAKYISDYFEDINDTPIVPIR